MAMAARWPRFVPNRKGIRVGSCPSLHTNVQVVSGCGDAEEKRCQGRSENAVPVCMLQSKRTLQRVGRGKHPLDASTTAGNVSTYPSMKRSVEVCSYLPSPSTRQRCGYASQAATNFSVSVVLFDPRVSLPMPFSRACSTGRPLRSDFPTMLTPCWTLPPFDDSRWGTPHGFRGSPRPRGILDSA